MFGIHNKLSKLVAFFNSRFFAYESCPYIESGLTFYNNDRISICCYCADTNELDIGKISEFHNVEELMTRLSRKRAFLRQKHRRGEPTFCRSCPVLRKGVWPKPSSMISHITLNHFLTCNLNCTYCGYRKLLKNNKDTSTEKVVEWLHLLYAHKLIHNHGSLDIGGGEPALLRELPLILDFIEKTGIKTHINTNASLFEKRFCQLAEKDLLRITLTPDAGNREVFQKIKGVDCFDKVWANVGRYFTETTKNVEVKILMQKEVCESKHLNDLIAMLVKTNVRIVNLDLEISQSENCMEYESQFAFMAENLKRLSIDFYWGAHLPQRLLTKLIQIS